LTTYLLSIHDGTTIDYTSEWWRRLRGLGSVATIFNEGIFCRAKQVKQIKIITSTAIQNTLLINKSQLTYTYIIVELIRAKLTLPSSERENKLILATERTTEETVFNNEKLCILITFDVHADVTSRSQTNNLPDKTTPRTLASSLTQQIEAISPLYGATLQITPTSREVAALWTYLLS